MAERTTNRSKRDDFPTPESPTRRIYTHSQSQREPWETQIENQKEKKKGTKRKKGGVKKCFKILKKKFSGKKKKKKKKKEMVQRK